MGDDLRTTIQNFNSERVSTAFVENSSINWLLDAKGAKSLDRHTDIEVQRGGLSEIIDQMNNAPALKFRGYSQALKGDTPDSVNLTGLFTNNSERAQLSIEMTSGRKETISTIDENQNVKRKIAGSCTPSGSGDGVCNFTITDGETVVANAEGSKKFLQNGASQTELNIFSADDAKTKLGTIKIAQVKTDELKLSMDTKIVSDK